MWGSAGDEQQFDYRQPFLMRQAVLHGSSGCTRCSLPRQVHLCCRRRSCGPVPAVLRAASRHDQEGQQRCLSAPCSDGKEGARDIHTRARGLALPSTYSGAVSLSMRSG